MKSRALAAAILFLSGCSMFSGNLRKDLEDPSQYDEPTVGGAYPESGMLDDDSGRSRVGHYERGLASGSYTANEGNSWVNSEQREQNLRDAGRGGAGPGYGDVSNLPPPVKREYRNGARATRDDFVDDFGEGSLWASNGQTNYYFTKNRIKGLGDIVTVTINDQLLKDVGTELKKNLTEEEASQEIQAADAKLKAKAAESKTKSSASKSSEEEEGSSPSATMNDIDVTESMGVKAGDTMMAEVLERYPNGNYKIRATKRIQYRGSMRFLTLMGVARAEDVNDSESVDAGKLYEYRLKIYR